MIGCPILRQKREGWGTRLLVVVRKWKSRTGAVCIHERICPHSNIWNLPIRCFRRARLRARGPK
jgi:hypothetical protein